MKIENKTILIVGGTGSLGQAIIRRLRAKNQLIVFSRDELKQWTLRNELKDDNVSFVVGDMRDRQRLEEVVITTNPNMIIIAAALKQVDTCELAPGESIKTNILGVQNLVEVTERNITRLDALEAVVMVSTDKACEPTNVYGMSKAIAERIVTSRSYVHEEPRFVTVRYGNVLESRGSIMPLFRYQAENAEAFTLTHEDMTRFAMTLDESIDLILTAATRGKSGETWIPRLRAMRIKDLAEIFARNYGKPIEVTGMRPGEKLHEMLVSKPESLRARTVDDFYVISSPLTPVDELPEIFEYSSNQDVLSIDGLKSYLDGLGIMKRKMEDFVGIHIDAIRKD
jgi:UDP-N-acetylglucosamine 4,6-dehydratase/5-epimerase